MKETKIRFLHTAALLVPSAAVLAAGATAGKPNVLVILADDLGYADVGFNGAKDIFTPHLDRLAQDGVIFRNGYVTHPYCGPCRAGLITGRYQARFGGEINVTYSPHDLYMGLPLTEKTIGDRMKAAGYRTGIIGKWHLGAAYPYHPNSRGFDYFYGFLGGGLTYFPENIRTTQPLTLPDGRPDYSANEGCALPLMRNDRPAEFNEYLTTALSRDAARFMTESRQPFFLYLAYNAPHSPLEAPLETVAKYAHIPDQNRRVYAAMIDEMDKGIGLILEALRNCGKLDNTLIFFLSDNGGVSPKPGHRSENWADNGPFRKGKGSMYEGGSHVPFIAHWPAGIPAGMTFDGLVSALDIGATAVELGGGDSSGNPLEGVNLIPYLTGEKSGSPHAALFWRSAAQSTWAVRTPQAKYLKEEWNSAGTELYDMISDPYESTNLVAQRPELRAELARLWNEWNAQNGTTVMLEAPTYQKSRLELFKKLDEEQREAAARRKPVVIK